MSAVLTPLEVRRDTADHPATIVRAVRRRRRRRSLVVNAGLTALLVGLFALRVLGGDYTITPVDFVRILAGAEIPGARFILMESKLPHAVLGVLAGVAFGLGGALFQTVLRNPLASPDLIGVSAGASAAAVFAIVVLGLSGLWLSGFAIAGALGVAAVIWLCAGPRGGYRLVLVGVAFAALLISFVQYLFARASVFETQSALVWLTGSLNQASWATIGRLAVSLSVLLVCVVLASRGLRLAELGADTARGLGHPPRRDRTVLALGVLLVATATAASGPISFVALLSGPIARRLNAGRLSLTGAALVGAVVVVGADHIASYAIPGATLPVGVVTGALGAPFLLWLLTLGAPGRSTS